MTGLTPLAVHLLNATHGEFSKPSPRWWRWLVVAGVPGVALIVLSADVARFINWWLS